MYGPSVTPLLPVSVCLMAGIVVGCWWLPTFPLPLLLAVLVLLALVFGRWMATVQTIAIFVCCVVAGMTLVQIQRDEAPPRGEVQGVVMSEPVERPKTIGVDLLVPSEGGRTLRCYLAKNERSRALGLGDEVVVRTGNSSPPTHNGSSTSSYFVHNSYWQSGGAALSQMSHWQRLRLWFLRQRHRLLQQYRAFNDAGDEYAVLAAMTLGDRSAQTKELRDTYSVSGASHVLAISGLHVGIVYMLLTWLTLGRRHFWLIQVATVAAIWAFALLTGLSASVTRAATMVSIYAVFANHGGRYSPVNVLCFAAIVMLVADVQTLFDVGFQLSFAAVFAILAFMPKLQALYQPGNAVLRWTWNLCLLSCCAQIGVAPLIAYYFGRFATYFMLTNIIVIPAATIILCGSLVSLLFPPVGVALLWVVRTLNGGVRLIASLPGASIDGLNPTVMQVVLVYVLFLLCYAIANRWIKYWNYAKDYCFIAADAPTGGPCSSKWRTETTTCGVY